MKFYTKIFFVLMLIGSIGTSCSKDIMGYEDEPAVYFFERFAINATNVSEVYERSFSFVPFPETVKDTTLYIKVKIMGNVSAADRRFYAEPADPATNAIAGTDYELLPGTIKANQMEGLLPVVLHRTEAMKTEIKKLKFKIADRGDFKMGTVERSFFTLTWNDAYLKPDNWDTLPGIAQYFGAYSIAKYKFIIEVLGISQFPMQTAGYNPAQYSGAQMQDFKAQLKSALQVYNNTHSTPLMDEFNNAVTFP